MKSNHQSQLTVTIPINDKQGRKIGERQVATFAGLLARAHEEGLREIRTELLQAPTKENGTTAIIRATVRTHRGTFTGIGDASPSNVGARVAAHLVRMAETRAKARALRDATNIGVVALEELDELLDEGASDERAPAVGQAQAASTASVSIRSVQSESHLMTEPQRRMLFRLATKHGVAPDNVAGWIMAQLGIDNIKVVTKRDASLLIERLQSSENGAAPLEVA